MTQTRLFGIILAAAFIALFSVILVVRSNDRPAQADTPHPGLNFAIGIDVNGDGTNDCGTGVPLAVGDGAPDPVPVEVTNTACVATEDAELHIRVYLMSNNGVTYGGEAAQVYYVGVTSKGRGTSVWTCHTFDVTFAPANLAYESAASTIGIAAPCNVPQTNVGLMNKFTFTCTQGGGSTTLGSGVSETKLTDGKFLEHRDSGPDVLSIKCGEGSSEVPGDSDCNGSVNSIDAALILQHSAGLLANVPCADGADANHDGSINSIDAALVLQLTAGLLDEL